MKCRRQKLIEEILTRLDELKDCYEDGSLGNKMTNSAYGFVNSLAILDDRVTCKVNILGALDENNECDISEIKFNRYGDLVDIT